MLTAPLPLLNDGPDRSSRHWRVPPEAPEHAIDADRGGSPQVFQPGPGSAQEEGTGTTMDIPQVLAAWLHTLALVIVMGYYGILARVILPALERSFDGPTQAAAVVAVERRALPLVVLSVALFTVTGTYLLFIDPNYEGPGNFFASSWTILMLIKHVLVIALVVLGVVADRLVRRVGEATDDSARAAALDRLELSAEGATGLGALAILLTAAAQHVA